MVPDRPIPVTKIGAQTSARAGNDRSTPKKARTTGIEPLAPGGMRPAFEQRIADEPAHSGRIALTHVGTTELCNHASAHPLPRQPVDAVRH